jgi:DNA-binding XRE family transcriptional regulator/quercetin dioxygenase-like cupin family protein
MSKNYPDGMASAPVQELLSSNLASNLRFQRHQRSLTQEKLARLCGLPRSTISQIESGEGNPTLSVLSRIALALHLSIEELLSTPHARCQFFRRGSLKSSSRGRGGGTIVSKLLPDPIPGMEIDRIQLRQGARLTGVPHRPGTREYLTCERGELTLRAAGETFVLGPGDVAAFDGDQPHSYHNDGNTEAIGFSVVTLAPVSR